MRIYEDIVTIILGLILTGGTFVLASEIKNNYNFSDFQAAVSFEGSRGAMETDNSTYNFGQISTRGEDKRHIFNIKNTSDKNIFLSKVYTSSDYLDAFIKIGEFEAGPFNIKDYLMPIFDKKKLEKGKDLYVKAVLRPGELGPLGMGLAEPFVVVEDTDGDKIILRTSVIVFP